MILHGTTQHTLQTYVELWMHAYPQTEHMQMSALEIVPERVLVLFQVGTSSLRSSLGTFFVPVPDHVKHFP